MYFTRSARGTQLTAEKVNHRSLGRELKIHNNLAKQMLFSFHQTQNAKKPGSVHATYIISGTPRPPAPPNGFHNHDGDDTVMQSSPPVSSLPDADHTQETETISKRTIMIVKEEHLEKAKARLEDISSIFVYSLEPSSLANLNVLSDCTREMFETHAREDPLEAWKQYGVIQNPNTRRRTGKRPTAVEMPTSQPPKLAQKPAATPKLKDGKPQPKAEAAGPGIAAGTTARNAAGAYAAPVSDLKTHKPAAPSFKREKSDIFSSFAKAKPKEKRDSGNAEPEQEAKDGTLVGMNYTELVR